MTAEASQLLNTQQAKSSKVLQETTDDDPALVERAQSGDSRAFDTLVRRYQRKAYAVAFGMVHNREAALDVTQDAFLKAHQNLARFRGGSSFYTWLYRIVMNLCIDHLRKERRRIAEELDERLAPPDDPGHADDMVPSQLGLHPDREAERKELRQAMAEAVQTLSEKHRAVIVLRELEQLSYAEMAETLQISKGTVMSRLFHARRNLRKALAPYLGIDPATLDGDGGGDDD